MTNNVSTRMGWEYRLVDIPIFLQPDTGTARYIVLCLMGAGDWVSGSTINAALRKGGLVRPSRRRWTVFQDLKARGVVIEERNLTPVFSMGGQ